MKNHRFAFRAWDKENKRMIFYSPFTLLVDGVEGDKFWKENYREFLTRFEHMQLIGLLDRNGKEIYEGDFVKFNLLGTDHIELIKWTAELQSFGKHSGFYIPANCEVIGNVWENEDLARQIKDKKEN